MASNNDVTGDPLISKPPTDLYRNNWESIFGKKPKEDNSGVEGVVEEASEQTSGNGGGSQLT